MPSNIHHFLLRPLSPNLISLHSNHNFLQWLREARQLQGRVLTYKCLHCEASQLLRVDTNIPRNTWASLDFVSGLSKKHEVSLFSFAED